MTVQEVRITIPWPSDHNNANDTWDDLDALAEDLKVVDDSAKGTDEGKAVLDYKFENETQKDRFFKLSEKLLKSHKEDGNISFYSGWIGSKQGFVSARP